MEKLYFCNYCCHVQILLDQVSSFLPQQFSQDIADNASTVCLAHLFTYQDFDEGTLGLAYVAPSKPQALGGLCPKRKGGIACNTQLLSPSVIVFKMKLETKKFKIKWAGFDPPSSQILTQGGSNWNVN